MLTENEKMSHVMRNDSDSYESRDCEDFDFATLEFDSDSDLDSLEILARDFNEYCESLK